jgi:hypothetical protein
VTALPPPWAVPAQTPPLLPTLLLSLPIAHANPLFPTTGVRFGEAANLGQADTLDSIRATPGARVFASPHERSDLPLLTDMSMPDGSRWLFTTEIIANNKVIVHPRPSARRGLG